MTPTATMPPLDLVQSYSGPRSAVGQRAIADIPEWPGSFTSSHSTFASLQSAVDAAGTSRKFEITASFAFAAVIQPHASDEFWFDPGVIITRSGAISNAIRPASGVTGVKVMNGKFDGFNAGTGSGIGNSTDVVIDWNQSNNWEIGYCEFNNTWYGVSVGQGGGFADVHDCLFNNIGGAVSAFQGRDVTFRDNKFGPVCGDPGSVGGTKFVGTRRTQWIHNYCLNGVRGGVWFDTANSEALVEWNKIEGTGSASPMGGVAFEANRWVDGLVTGNDQGTKILISNGMYNTCRYNYFLNNLDVGLHVLHSSGTVVGGNVFSNDVVNQPNIGSIAIEFDGNLTVNQGGFVMHLDIEQNHFSDNKITQNLTGRKAVTLSISNVADTVPYFTNTKDNSFDFNTYDVLDPVSTLAFAWNGNKTFAQWQGIPQDAGGSAF
ncbi:MAG: hypothetical protein ACRDIC_05985 [bacterium]